MFKIPTFVLGYAAYWLVNTADGRAFGRKVMSKLSTVEKDLITAAKPKRSKKGGCPDAPAEHERE